MSRALLMLGGACLAVAAGAIGGIGATAWMKRQQERDALSWATSRSIAKDYPCGTVISVEERARMVYFQCSQGQIFAWSTSQKPGELGYGIWRVAIDGQLVRP